MVSQQNWHDRNVLRRTRMYILMLLIVIGGLILFLQHQNIMRLLQFLFN